MTKTNDTTKITVACPSGHRLKGDFGLVGQTVKCPKCKLDFVFAPSRPVEVAKPVSSQPTQAAESQSMSDTGVMRILGEMGNVPAAPDRSDALKQPDVAMRPCSRCGVAILESLAVCNHCHCYVGVMPTFLSQINNDGETPRR